MVFAKERWLQMWHDVTVLLKTIPNREEREAVDSLKLIGSLDFCTAVQVNVITKLLLDFEELRLWFLSKTIDCKCDTELLSS